MEKLRATKMKKNVDAMKCEGCGPNSAVIVGGV